MSLFFTLGVHRSWLSSLLVEHFQFDWTILLTSLHGFHRPAQHMKFNKSKVDGVQTTLSWIFCLLMVTFIKGLHDVYAWENDSWVPTFDLKPWPPLLLVVTSHILSRGKQRLLALVAHGYDCFPLLLLRLLLFLLFLLLLHLLLTTLLSIYITLLDHSLNSKNW